MGDGDKAMSGLTGILNWSLAHNDGTAPAKPVSEEDRKFFFEAMAAVTVDPTARMKSISAEVALNPAATLTEEQLELRIAQLEELQDHVEDIDAACDLSKVGGLPALLGTIGGSPHASLRALAAEVVATAVQNNPKAQQALLDAGALDCVLRLARSDVDAGARLKGLFAVSSLVRQFPPSHAPFRLGDGFGLLRASMADEDPRIQRRAFLLARHFASTCDAHLDTMVQLGFIRAGAAALLSPKRDVRESALGMLLDVARHVDFQALPAALDDFRHPALATRLHALRSALAEEEEAGAEERDLADRLARMLAPGGASDAAEE